MEEVAVVVEVVAVVVRVIAGAVVVAAVVNKIPVTKD